ncbi:hypothetical protein JK232_18140 [Nissabacter archeti]|uniref:TgtA5 cluster protein 2 n=1 Tax=Nissabacter archeti TaxID=1917880 RepID=A0ABS5JLE2_9GAMM|nr:hypothetical protein [Nissabacter archeti]
MPNRQPESAAGWPGEPRLHLITTCTLRKAHSAGETVFPCSPDSLQVTGERWRRQIAHAADENRNVMPAGELYRGAHWLQARKIVARWPGTELWAISAGLGLRHHADPAVPYEATFHTMPFPGREVWALLTARPPLPGHCASLAELMRRYPNDSYVIAGSPVYISATEQDIQAGIAELTDACNQLTIVTSQGYRGELEQYVSRSHAGMLSALKTNMTCLNIALAGKLIADRCKSG